MGIRGRTLRGLVLAALLLNLLDLSTSAIPSEIDRARPVPARSRAALVVQLALLVPLALWAAPRARQALRVLRALPVPRPALVTLGAFVAVQCAHIALRAETYPFSCVGMFSNAAPAATASSVVVPAYVVRRGERPAMLNFMREGNPFAARFFDWDYKAAWVMRQYAADSGVARAIVARRLAERSLPPPVLAAVEVSVRDGRTRLLGVVAP